MLSADERDRKAHYCVEVDLNDKKRFPEVSQELFYMMEQEFYDDTSIAHCFPFVCSNGVETYIDIYIFDIMALPKCYKRYILINGERLSLEDERAFLGYIHSELVLADKRCFEAMNRTVMQKFPSLHYKGYSVAAFALSMEHIYFGFHNSSKEILYKAGLEYLAYQLYDLKFNPKGTDPKSILRHDWPMRLLRILNEPAFSDVISDEYELAHFEEVYYAFSSLLGHEAPTSAQWEYLSRIYDHDGPLAQEGFNKTLYNALSRTADLRLIEQYEQFFMLRKEFPDVKRLKKIPRHYDIRDTVDRLKTLVEIKNDSELNENIKARVKEEGSFYESLENDDYIVVLPHSSYDFAKEALEQGNCLAEYSDAHAWRISTILFLRKKDQPQKSFVTLEVSKGSVIEQVFAEGNELPSKTVFKFLMEYSRERWLFCNPYSLIIEKSIELDHDLNINDELWYFAMNYCPPLREGESFYEEEEPYEQLSLSDCFPDLFKTA